jgi:hypothetical protein
MQEQTRNNTNPNSTPHKGSGKKGKGKGKNKNQGNRRPKEPCNYCGIPGHSTRDCRRRQRDEKEKQDSNEKKTKEVKNYVLIADETDLMFTQHVVYADKINEKEQQKPMRTSVAPTEQTENPEPQKENERHTVDPAEKEGNISRLNSISRHHKHHYAHGNTMGSIFTGSLEAKF